MNRRDFLLLRTEGRSRVLELSCERLYMQYSQCTDRSDAEQGAGRGEGDAGAPTEPHWSEGEPPASVDSQTVEALFDDLARDLASVEVLHLMDQEWLADDEFRRRVDALIEWFEARGGRVEARR